jgi:LmbE family N-acetylglucosaminyl deacetylase
MLRKLLCYCFVFISISVWSQKPHKPNASELFHQLQKLNFLGTALYVAAHPDDENTRIISYMANHQKARTGYLSLTRGDGGQNLIGPELRELLGVIRTQELIEARKIDGGEQFFSSANDFGFSKVPDETLKIWDKDKVMKDIVLIIRKFKPDVIINRFDHRSPGTTHGHHTSSAMLSLEAFDMTNDPKIFPEQLNITNTWQPKRLLFNTSWWFYGGKEKFEQADKSNLISLKTGVYYPLLGQSNQEIAALSRSQHQSQGFGTMGVRGDEIEYLELIKGTKPVDTQNLFEGIDTSWNRVKGGKNIGQILSEVEKQFYFSNPSLSIPKLVEAYQLIQNLEDTHWKNIKTKEISELIYGCAGLFLEAVAAEPTATTGSEVRVTLEAINRSEQNIQWVRVKNLANQQIQEFSKSLAYNVSENIDWTFTLDTSEKPTQPYWLMESGTLGMYQVLDLEKIGEPDVIRKHQFEFELDVLGANIKIKRPLVYKYNDAVLGEVYEPFDIVPEITSEFEQKIEIFKPNEVKKIGVKIWAEKQNVQGTIALNLPKDWEIIPQEQNFEIKTKGTYQTVYFDVKSPKNPVRVAAQVKIVSGNQIFLQERIKVDYEHITKQQIFVPSQSQLISIDIQRNNEKIAYIMGAGDEVPTYLAQLGYDVTLVQPQNINRDFMKNFDVFMLGIRAFNTVESLKYQQEMLFDLVKEGKTMIVQYNTTAGLLTKNIAPYPLKISRDRVTEEDAVVRFLAPNHPVLNYPNKINSQDFENWVQEQGLYYPDQWDPAFTPIISSNDTQENPKNGALLVAQYGKGYYVYSGLSFFRELPAGVTGAYRLLANMISLGTSKN